ncbi:UdgX family uracil-DNA binding protein [Naasia sp. SYSU D00057]|uniref:UdgX family uracil-DNA binding protein n=1 Tax=Naasia sp. SYSU D00057 TaxID=2817380 RepID=UPI001B318024|nr:UdgX family uracil-DNA binding protein [Naasia sp. SYSU D00057]
MAEFARPGAEQWVPDDAGLDGLRAAAPDCRGCELYRDATQVVFGSGPDRARLMLVGEQPGDSEDKAGEPFVGPAGRLLADALAAAGVRAEDAYVTNAVKHFRFEERGKRRLHKSPAVAHIEACHPWLDAEFRTVRPDVVVALGATAARGVLGRTVRVLAERGRVLDERPAVAPEARVVLTVHPSAVLRLRGKPEFDPEFDGLVADLRTAADLL